jgi:hypothetical protein
MAWKLGQLETGTKYRVKYKRQGGNYQWSVYEFIGSYLGDKKHTGELMFDLRPSAGTSSIEPDQILEFWEMPYSTEHRIPIRRGKYNPV